MAKSRAECADALAKAEEDWLAAGAALCALLANSLEHIAAVDAITTGVSIGVIAAVGIAAASLPALRVLRVHPSEVLRS